MKRPPIAALALLLAACHTTDPNAAVAPTADAWQPVRMLTGYWRHDADGGGASLEAWTAPHGDVMFGQNRSLAGGELVFFELLSIERRGERLVYVARPGGGPATEFVMTAHDANSVTFENPEHDFPKRIRYRRDDGGDALRAVVDDGTDDGQRLAFGWRRVR